jgi:hypothetical protein
MTVAAIVVALLPAELGPAARQVEQVIRVSASALPQKLHGSICTLPKFATLVPLSGGKYGQLSFPFLITLQVA